MASQSQREALRGAETQVIDLIFQASTSEQWAELLKGPLERDAAGQGNGGLAQQLVEAGADRMADQSRREALRGAEVQAMDLIAEAVESEEWANVLKMPLERAAGQGNVGLVQKLVEAGAQSENALHAAVRGGHRDVVRDLLESGASINAKHTGDGKTPLHVAAAEGKAEMVQLLMLKGADINAPDDEKSTPLYLAVYHGHVAVALRLLAGADISFQCGKSKATVLHTAAGQGHVDILRALIEHGADVDDGIDECHLTPLHYAAQQSKAEVIDALAEAGATVDARCRDGSTPLHCAAYHPSLEALTALLKHGARANAQDYDLDTPLLHAAFNAGTQGISEVVDALLRSGADETIVNKEGWTAAHAVTDHVEEEDRLAEDVERVRKLLANAPADRAWRRRGYLVLCRACPDRVQHAHEISSALPDLFSPGVHSAAQLRRPGARSCVEGTGRTVVGEGIRADWVSVLATVLGLQEEGIFRTIVEYL